MAVVIATVIGSIIALGGILAVCTLIWEVSDDDLLMMRIGKVLFVGGILALAAFGIIYGCVTAKVG